MNSTVDTAAVALWSHLYPHAGRWADLSTQEQNDYREAVRLVFGIAADYIQSTPPYKILDYNTFINMDPNPKQIATMLRTL